jgi:undecaprenyl-diphosphatase
MLLSIPAVAGAGFLVFVDLLNSNSNFAWTGAIVAGVLAFLTALGAIHLLMRWLRTASFLPFIVYRLFMGGAILVWIYWA